MFRPPHQQTLFHLVPRNDTAKQSLDHPHNAPYASTSSMGQVGLEVGYHVQEKQSVRVILTVGREGDLKMTGSGIGRIHIAFEIQLGTKVVMLSARQPQPTEITISAVEKNCNEVEVVQGYFLSFGVRYEISISGRKFSIVWRTSSLYEAARMVRAEYEKAVARPWDRTKDTTHFSGKRGGRVSSHHANFYHQGLCGIRE